MRRLQYRALELRAVRTVEQIVLDLLLGISGEQHREIFIRQMPDHRLIIGIVLVLLRRARRNQIRRRIIHFEFHSASEVKLVAVLQMPERYICRLRRFDVIRINLRRRRHAIVVNLFDLELAVFDQTLNAAYVIRMRVRQDHSVELLDVGLVELRHQLFALVDIARVDQDILFLGSDQNCVALPDVEHLDRQIAVDLNRWWRTRRRFDDRFARRLSAARLIPVRLSAATRQQHRRRNDKCR